MKNNPDKENIPVTPVVLLKQNIISLISMAVVSWSVAFLLWIQTGIDKTILVWHNPIRDNAVLFEAGRLVSRYGMSVILFVFLVLLVLSYKYSRLKDYHQVYLLIFLSFGIAGIAGDLLKEVFDRARPMAEYAGQINVTKMSQSPSFPSGHGTKSIALILPFIYVVSAKETYKWINLVKGVLIFLAAAVCYSRILLGAHFLSDILAGLGMALMSLPVTIYFGNLILKKKTQKNLKVAVRIWAVLLFLLMLYIPMI